MNLLHRIIGIKIPLDGELKLSSKNKAGGTMNWDQESISETKGNIAMPFSIHALIITGVRPKDSKRWQAELRCR